MSRSVVVFAVVVLAALVGCQSGGPPPVPTPVVIQLTPPPGPLPACADAATPLPLPAAFPREFPLPGGTVVLKQEERSDNRLIITVVMPYDFQTMLDYLNKAIPQTGFTDYGGEMEPGREAESNYMGHGVHGRWILRPTFSCPGISGMQILSGP